MCADMPKITPAAERFWSSVDRRTTDECWPWTRSTTRAGYGRVQEDYPSRRVIYAHRFSYELHNGAIPDGLHVRHQCDNPTCVNPAHLSLGTHADNMRDMAERNRSSGGRFPGERNHQAKLNDTAVREIKHLLSGGSHSLGSLARAYGVDNAVIARIRDGKAWRHVTIDT
jgi:hypothetical protein